MGNKLPAKGTRNVGIYVRISKDSARTGAGVARQEKACQELVKKHSTWQVKQVYSDNDVSAFSGKRRDRYEDLLDDITAGHIDVVVVWHPDRLYRRLADLERYIDVCKPRDVPTYAVQSAGEMDLTTPGGRMVARTLGNMAQYESEQKGERQRFANQQRAAKGKHFGTRRCFGWEEDGIHLRPAEAEAIQKAAQRIINDGSLAQVARDWNEAGLIPPQGKRRTKAERDEFAAAVEAAVTQGEAPPPLPPLKPSKWVSSSVRLTLRNPRLAKMRTYRGEIVRDEETGKPVEAEWERVLDHATWQALQRALDEIAEKWRFPSAERQLLSGLAVCDTCGSPMMSGGTRNGKRRYRCRGNGGHAYREAAPIHSLVTGAVLRVLKRPEARKLLTPRPADVDVDAIERRLAEIAADEVEMGKAFASRAVTLGQLTAANEAWVAERAELESRLPAPGNSVLGELLAADDVDEMWASYDQDAKRAVIDALFEVRVKSTRTKEKAYLDWKNRVINPDSVALIPRWRDSSN